MIQPFIQVIDFETTGLIDPQPIQYGEVLINRDEIYLASQVLIKPTKPIEWGAMGVTGITPEYIEDNHELTYNEVSDGMGWVQDVTTHLITHNATYDLKFIHPESLTNVKVVCTLKLARKLIDKSLCGDHKNSTLYYYLGCYKNPIGKEYITSTHSALTDAMMTANILLKLLDNFNLTIDQAYDLINAPDKPEDITICPFNKHIGKKWEVVIRDDKDYLTWLIGSGKIKNVDMKNYLDKLIGGN